MRIGLWMAAAILMFAACEPSARLNASDSPSALGSGAVSPSPAPASEFMLSTWIYPFTHSRTDFYSWDGSFLRTLDVAGNLLASADGRYFVNFTTSQLWTATGELIRTFNEPTLAEGSTSLNWASDGDYFCGLQQNANGYDLVVIDVPGNIQRFPLALPAVVTQGGIRAMYVDCGMTAHRAVVFGGLAPNSSVAVMSLPDGQLERVVQLGANFITVGKSADLHWLAASEPGGPGGQWKTEVIDLTDGTVRAQLIGFADVAFMPDGQNLIGNDQQYAATVLDWRTKNELWAGRGHVAEILAASDPSTNKALLWLSTGSTQAGTDTYDYWIVDGAGSAVRFRPKDCASPVVSASRC